MRTLIELEARFLKIIDAGNVYGHVENINEADGLVFLCPECFEHDPIGPVGTHRVICWQPKVPLSMSPGPGRWTFTGTSLDDVSLVANSSSVALQSGCAAHFFVRNGAASKDCSSGEIALLDARKEK